MARFLKESDISASRIRAINCILARPRKCTGGYLYIRNEIAQFVSIVCRDKHNKDDYNSPSLLALLSPSFNSDYRAAAFFHR